MDIKYVKITYKMDIRTEYLPLKSNLLDIDIS